jgi:hypothetical protein
MPAPEGLYQQVEQQIKAITDRAGLRVTAGRRLALLVTGIIAARSGVIRQVAAELDALGLTRASGADSIARRLRRTLADERLTAAACYAPVLGQVVDWAALARGGRPVVLALDESTQGDRVHLLRLSLTYRGASLPLAWALWEQNRARPEGDYWRQVEAVLDQAAGVLPPGVEVVVTADRAYDVPAFIDRVAARGWHWVVRCKAGGSLRFRDRGGAEHALAALVRRRLPCPGRRWRARGQVFKEAGWRAASVVGLWGRGHKEPLVVLSDLAPSGRVLRQYRRRFWVEPGFRNDKTKGWRWEDSQVRDLGHQARLVLALAWASLVALCLGAAAARAKLAARLARPARPGRRRAARPWQPEHARESLFTLGLHAARRRLARAAGAALAWCLPDPHAVSWTVQWQRAQRAQRALLTVRP